MEQPPSFRDVFLSHRSDDKPFVRELAGRLEQEPYNDRHLWSWIDEAEIRPGQSCPGAIETGLEISRYFAVIMSPEYFKSKSGWTDAEWHSAIHADPDNRKGRILPILIADCPYIPSLLKHLNMIDMRGSSYELGYRRLISTLRDEPLPRPTSYRGQLITPGGRIDRTTLMSERSVPQADPDPFPEQLSSNLLPVDVLPKQVFIAPVSENLMSAGSKGNPSKQKIKELIHSTLVERGGVPYTPSFRMHEGMVWTFHDLSDPESALAPVVSQHEIDELSTIELIASDHERRLVTSLLNMSVSRHASKCGLVFDNEVVNRFYFPAKDGKPNTYTWTPSKNRATRTVAKPYERSGTVAFWTHQGASLKMVFLANKYYLQISPTWVITEDGYRKKSGPKIGAIISRWTSPERNMNVLYHVRFWSTVLRMGQSGPISVRAGDQFMLLDPNPAYIQLAYGIQHDTKNLLDLLDVEITQLEEHEEQIAKRIASGELSDDSITDWSEDDGIGSDE